MNRDGGGKQDAGAVVSPIRKGTMFGPFMECAGKCARPVDQNEPHVRVGVVHRFTDGGKMVNADVYHILCYNPEQPQECTCVGGSWCAIHGDVPDDGQMGMRL